MKKFTLFICLVIILNVPISAYAQATATTPTVTIAAGTGAAVGGAYQGYTSKTAAAATALTIAVLSATGAAVKLTEASVQAGKTVYQVINDKFAQWVGGTSAEELSPSEAEELQSRFKVITGGGGDPNDPDNNDKNGVNIDEDGKLWFSPGSLSMLKKFTDWLESQDDGILTQAPPVPSDTVNVGPWSTVTLSSLEVKQISSWNGFLFTTNKPVAVVFSGSLNSSKSRVFFISNESFTTNVKRLDLWNNTTTNVGNERSTAYRNYYYYQHNVNIDPTSANIEGARYGNYNNATDVINEIQQFNTGSSSNEIESDGIYASENWDNSLLDNDNNQKLVVDPGILNGFNIDSDKQIAIPDYIDLIIQQAEERAKREAQPDQNPVPQELPVPLIDPLAGTKSPANWIDTTPDDVIQDPIESEKRDPDPEDPKDPVIDDDTPTDPEDAVELLKVDLTKIFPFCLPWDIYRILAKFNADPVTPSITIDWGNMFGSIGVDFETTLDLHDYDGVAYILRTMETVAFVVGLAVATKSIFLGS